LEFYFIVITIGSIAILALLYLYLNINNSYKIEILKSDGIKSSYIDLQMKYAILKTKYEEEIKSSQEKLQVLQNAKDELSKEFKVLANQIFEDKSRQFNHSQKEQLEILNK